MGTFLVGIKKKIGKYGVMDSEMELLYREWCKDNLKGTIDEWFYGREYTLEDIVEEKEYIITYITSRFLKWYIEKTK